MTRSKNSEFVLFDPEIERTLHTRRRQQQREDSTVMENFGLNAEFEQGSAQFNQQQGAWRAWGYRVFPYLDVERRSIIAPSIEAINFELKVNPVVAVRSVCACCGGEHQWEEYNVFKYRKLKH